MKTLVEILAQNKDTDKGTRHSYDACYEGLIAPIRNQTSCLIEVGVRWGGSLRAWAEYFSNAHIFGIDNASETNVIPNLNHSRIEVIKADTCRPSNFHDVVRPFFLGKLADVIIDDGCHHPYAQICTFALLSPLLKDGGIYLTEDVQDIKWAQEMAGLFGGEVIDRREVKGCQDDILWLWRKVT